MDDVVTDTEANVDLQIGGAIEGFVYHDVNGNGTQDAGEPPLSNVWIGGDEYDPPERCCLGSGDHRTASTGFFRVEGLPPGMDLRISADGSEQNFITVFYDAASGESETTNWDDADRVQIAAGVDELGRPEVVCFTAGGLRGAGTGRPLVPRTHAVAPVVKVGEITARILADRRPQGC